MRWLLVAFVILGCGGESQRDELAGTEWALSINPICSFVQTFGESGEYSRAIGCELASGSIGLQQEIGTYDIAGTQLTMIAAQSTCADADKVSTVGFSVTPTTLTIVTPNSVTVFTKLAPGPSTGGTAVFGCHDFAAGVFTPMPLAPL